MYTYAILWKGWGFGGRHSGRPGFRERLRGASRGGVSRFRRGFGWREAFFRACEVLRWAKRSPLRPLRGRGGEHPAQRPPI